jgi:AcrR family transcriptional regulator
MINDNQNDRDRKEDVPGLYTPQQGRSHRAMSSVLKHFNQLLKEKVFGDIKISAISKASGVGVGTIYFRFSSKEYLLIALAEKIVREEIEPSYKEFFLPDTIKKTVLEEYLLKYFTITSSVFKKFSYLLKPLTLISRETSDNTIPEFINRMNVNILQKLSKNIITLARHNNPAVSKKSVEFALLWAGASLREQFLYKQNNSDLMHVDNRLFLIELSKALTKYLESE